MMRAVEVVQRVAPRAHANYMQAFETGDGLFTRHGINTPLRLAHFLAQVMHESGGAGLARESMRYTAPRIMQIFGVNHHSAAVTQTEAARLAGDEEGLAERVYGLGNPRKARELGNSRAGDGFRYRGGGLMQTTGRGNYRRMGEKCGIDFESDPDGVASPENALKPALAEWSEGGLNALADRDDIRGITRKINGGFNGIEDRKAWFDKIFRVLSGRGGPASFEVARPDGDTKALQKALNELGANPELEVDGRSGPATEAAVRAFQRANGLPADGVAGPVTKAAIELRLATIGP